MQTISLCCPVCQTPYTDYTTVCTTCVQVGNRLSHETVLLGQTEPLFTYMPLRPGQHLADGRYTIQQALSKGGMGAIYLATDRDAFDRLVVVKELLTYFDPTDPRQVQSAQERFLDEARTLAALRHPAIPQILTYFQEGAHNYIVMEYVDGADLEQTLTRTDPITNHTIVGKPYPWTDVIRWGMTVCRVLEYLARQQPHPVIHHDIKPANLILDVNSGDIRLVDFGTAKARLLQQRQAGGTTGQQTSIYGTSGYAAPEQHRNQSEPRSDVYALAATLYHLATDDDPREHPFAFPRLAELGSFGQVLVAALHDDVAPRPTATELRRRLETLLVPLNGQLLQTPDGTDVTDVTELAHWCEAHWQQAVEWLYGTLPHDIEHRWGKTVLAQDLRTLVQRYDQNQDLGLDAVLAFLDPHDYGSAPHTLRVDPQLIDFGYLAARSQATHTLMIANAGRRCAHIQIELPAWITLSQAEYTLPPGQELVPTLRADLRRAPGQTWLRAEAVIQTDATAPIRLPARANVSSWLTFWKYYALPVGLLGVFLVVMLMLLVVVVV